MSNKKENAIVAQGGVDVSKITFDENGEVLELDDAALNEVCGGLMEGSGDTDSLCDIGCEFEN